ncbi:MAG: FAD-binding oxidoreductase [Paracoccus sp. (in: a-proteobacteria)]|nr:FAD-binding oxidoreductase [Paracoccus sp. (in: a-proteobacteria)]
MAEILVLGAGMVGISTALALQARGHDVTVVDRAAPGKETSFGNAGIIQAEAVEPYALPRDLATLLNITWRRTNDVSWTFRGVAGMIPALWGYFRSSGPKRYSEISTIYAQLIAKATGDHEPLIAAAGVGNLIAKEGLSIFYRDPAKYEKAAKDAERITARYGARHRAMDGEAYRREEPALTKAPAGVVHWLDSWSCASPGDLVGAYAELFKSRGGRVLTGDAASLAGSGKGWSVAADGGTLEAEDAVIALGPWSPGLLRGLGYRVPMVYKRGYHGHFEVPRTPIRPFMDTSVGVVATPTLAGLRIATGAALVRRDSPPDIRQLDRGRAALGDIIEIGKRIDEPQWVGTRPCMPDMLPMVGPAPRHKGLWFNFGHGHQGFTLGPTTGEMLAALHAGEESDLAKALSPARRV